MDVTLGMNYGCVVIEALVYRTFASFIVEVGRCLENEEGDCRKEKYVLVDKADECHSENSVYSCLCQRLPV